MAIRILPVNFFDQATVSVSPAALTNFPVTNLQSDVRSDRWRSPYLDPQVLLVDWGGETRPMSAWGIFPALEDACLIGVRARVQGYADLARTSQNYDSGEVDLVTFINAGWGAFPWGGQPWAFAATDRTARRAGRVKYFSRVTVAALKITITNAGAVDTPYFEASRIWVAEYVQAPYNAAPGAAPAWKPNADHNRTYGASLRRNRRSSPTRELRFSTKFTSEADRSIWSDLMYVCDPAAEIVVSLFPADADPKKERDFTVLGSLETLNPQVFESNALHTLQLAVVES
jgi:hypothetical protein